MSDLRILHVDMDAFFAAIEQRDRPQLRGRPVVVGGPLEGRGVVSTASYEARRFGVQSAMPLSVARRRCPSAVFLPVDMARYREVSRQLLALFQRFTSLVEPLSLDEAFLDLGPGADGPGEAVLLKAAIRSELDLTASIGVSFNKFLAKLASDLDKPDGLLVIPAESAREVIAPLPVRRLWGIGPRGEAFLHERGLYRIGDVARVDPALLRPAFGRRAEEIVRLAQGIDHRPIEPVHPVKSLSEELTFPRDVRERAVLEAALEEFAQALERRLIEAALRARTVTVKVRLADFTTLTRSRTMPAPTSSAQVLLRAAKGLLLTVDADRQRVRLIGLGVSGLAGRDRPEQIAFPFYH